MAKKKRFNLSMHFQCGTVLSFCLHTSLLNVLMEFNEFSVASNDLDPLVKLPCPVGKYDTSIIPVIFRKVTIKKNYMIGAYALKM